MTLRQTVAPTAPAVTLEEAKEFYRILSTDEDSTIEMTIAAATAKAEQITNRQLSRTTFEFAVDGFAAVRLPKPPFVEVKTIEYIDISGNKVVWSDFKVEMDGEIAVVSFPTTPTDAKGGRNSVFITYEAGYEELPDPLKSWILIYGLTIFEQRENMVIGTSVSLEPNTYYNHLLDSYRVVPI